MIKKIFSFLIVAVMMTACGGGDDNPAPAAASILGSWEMHSMSLNGQEYDLSATSSIFQPGGLLEEDGFAQITFRESSADFYVTYSGYTDEDSGDYSLSGMQLILGGESYPLSVLTNEVMTMMLPSDEGAALVTFVKIPDSKIQENIAAAEQSQTNN